MKDRITAIIIDPKYLEHDYANVKYDDGSQYSEKYFNLVLLDSGKDIMRKIYEVNGVDAIVSVENNECWNYLGYMPYEFRRKWTHIPEFNPSFIAANIIATLLINVNRKDDPPKFSFFTCTHGTSWYNLHRLYDSMCAQTYPEWNWFVLDDSVNDKHVCGMLDELQDPRITIIRNHTKHGNIGFNKHVVAMMCDGDFLVEVDHDDELIEDCLQRILEASKLFPDSDFFYSNCAELKGESLTPIIYGKGWGWGEGLTKTEVVKGREITFSESPGVNPYSIRTIYAQPNHVRCWKKDFYHKIGGHNVELSVLDDQEILIRTFLNGRMTKIDKVLYLQYEGDGERGVSKDNTQSIRFGEIQRLTMLLKHRYDKDIHERILSLGFNDNAWNEEEGRSVLWQDHESGKEMMNYTYIPQE